MARELLAARLGAFEVGARCHVTPHTATRNPSRHHSHRRARDAARDAARGSARSRIRAAPCGIPWHHAKPRAASSSVTVRRAARAWFEMACHVRYRRMAGSDVFIARGSHRRAPFSLRFERHVLRRAPWRGSSAVWGARRLLPRGREKGMSLRATPSLPAGATRSPCGAPAATGARSSTRSARSTRGTDVTWHGTT